jgi:hypothetical protein
MKRRREEIFVHSFRDLPQEILQQIVSQLDLCSFRSLVQTLLGEAYNWQGRLQNLLEKRFPSVYNACLQAQIAEVAEHGEISKLIKECKEEILKKRLRLMIRAASNRLFPIVHLAETPLCQRCMQTTSTDLLWPLDKNMPLCSRCLETMFVVYDHASARSMSDTYKFLSEETLRELCLLSPEEDTGEFAHTRGIRRQSQMNGGPGIYAVEEEFYLLLDARPYFSEINKS